MSTNGIRAAIYLRVSRDDQTTENQRLVLEKVAERRGWLIVQTHEDQGISGAKGRDQRPAFDQMLKDAVRRQFDVLMVWSIDRLGRSVLHVASALAGLSAGNGILKVAALVGVGSGTVQRVKREMAGELAKAACTPTIVSCTVRDRLAIGKSRPFRREVAARSR
jgi:DNA invertase Pin-like site-specific DNA recombinase